uniref:Nudix hydrolase domain-containing protein n=1 Tax=Panagrolaimus sp. ES5 TaxID=591445 RepID=A0AC34GXL2_9BILA
MSTSTTTTTDNQSSNNSALVPTRIINDVCFRFLEGVPQDYRKDNMRVLFEIEMAHWFYLDNYFDNPDFPDCKNVGFKDFSRLIFKQCAYLKSRANQCDKILDEFYLYKQHIPTNGAIMVDKSLEYVLLVQGYFASTNSWGFPKGKVNECEKPIDCAIREVLEETGYDITGKVNEKRSFSRYTNGRALTQLFVATDVDMDFKFQPHANKEIRKIQWFKIDLLPHDRNDVNSPARVNMKPNNFYNVVPFVADILQFVKKEKSRRARKAKKEQQQQVNGKINAIPSQQSFTGETFLKMLSFPSMASPLPSTSSSSASTLSDQQPKGDRILVYTAPVEEKQAKKQPASSASTPQVPSVSPIPDAVLPSRPASSASQKSSTFESCEEATLAIAKLLNIKPKLLGEHGKSQTQPTISIPTATTPSSTPQRFSKKSKNTPLRDNSTTKNQSIFY